MFAILQSIFTNGVVIGEIQNKFMKHHHKTYFTPMQGQDRATLTQGRLGLLMWIQAADRKYLVSSLQCRGSWIVGIWPLHHVRVMTDTDSDSGSPPSISQPSGGADNVFSLATGRKILFLLHKTGRKQPGGGKSGHHSSI